MKKWMEIFLIFVCVLGLAGCAELSSDEQEHVFGVYSFCGANEQFEVSNGVIILNTEEIFYGGDLDVLHDELFSNVASYTTTFYTIRNGEQRVIISNAVVDETGGSVNMEGELGKASGDGFILGDKVERIDDLRNNLWFELKTVDTNGQENIYQLQLTVTEITE